ncbi:hypothetical protein LY76DRAFT_659191 [Colletotrichum caudatum]|nr:hypothetical protein LY76DRAFT_659191 [Colletotrichum caudatum]
MEQKHDTASNHGRTSGGNHASMQGRLTSDEDGAQVKSGQGYVPAAYSRQRKGQVRGVEPTVFTNQLEVLLRPASSTDALVLFLSPDQVGWFNRLVVAGRRFRLAASAQCQFVTTWACLTNQRAKQAGGQAGRAVSEKDPGWIRPKLKPQEPISTLKSWPCKRWELLRPLIGSLRIIS